MLHVKEEKRGRKVVVDETLKACDKCGQVWEKVNKKVNRLYNLLERIEKNGRRSK